MSAPLIVPAAVRVGQTATSALFLRNGQPIVSIGYYDTSEHQWHELSTREPTVKEWPFPRTMTLSEIEEYEV